MILLYSVISCLLYICFGIKINLKYNDIFRNEISKHFHVFVPPCDVSIEIKSSQSTFRKLWICFKNLQTFFSYIKLRVYFHPEYKYWLFCKTYQIYVWLSEKWVFMEWYSSKINNIINNIISPKCHLQSLNESYVCCSLCLEIAALFISRTLKTVWDIFNIYICKDNWLSWNRLIYMLIGLIPLRYNQKGCYQIRQHLN